MILGSKPDGENHQGVYDRHQFSSIHAGKVLRSVLRIYRNRDFLPGCYVERLPSRDGPSKAEYAFKYHGFVFPIAGRVSAVDFEGVQKNELNLRHLRVGAAQRTLAGPAARPSLTLPLELLVRPGR